jgi:hypothetical protein
VDVELHTRKDVENPGPGKVAAAVDLAVFD